MPSRVTSFHIPEDLYRRVNIASASIGLSTSEYIRAAIRAALDTHSEHDAVLAAAFGVIDKGFPVPSKALVSA